MFVEEQAALTPAATRPYDVATITPVRACRQFRITLETNRYSVPAEFAGQRLTLRAYPDRLCIYHPCSVRIAPRPAASPRRVFRTSNRAFKDWPEIFNNDSMLTSALLDRLLHHTETVLIEGRSYRMKDIIEP